MENEEARRTEALELGAVLMPGLCAAEIIITKLVEHPEWIVPTLLVVVAGGSIAGIVGFSLSHRLLKAKSQE